MSHRLRAIGVLACLLLALPSGVAAADAGLPKPGRDAQKPGTTPKPKPAPSTPAKSTTAPSIDVAAGLHVAATLASRSTTSTKSGDEMRGATLVRMVGALEFSHRRCEQAVGAAEQAGNATQAKKVSTLCRAVSDELAVARQVTGVTPTKKIRKLASAIRASSRKAQRQAKAAHADSELLISAVALRLVLAEAIDSATSPTGTNAIIGEKGSNAIIGEKGSNAIIGEKGSNAIIGEKGMNGIIGEKGSNALTGKISRALDAEIVDLAVELLDGLASNGTLAQQEKVKAKELAAVRDAIRASKTQSASTQKRALQAADWANEGLITDLQGP